MYDIALRRLRYRSSRVLKREYRGAALPSKAYGGTGLMCACIRAGELLVRRAAATGALARLSVAFGLSRQRSLLLRRMQGRAVSFFDQRACLPSFFGALRAPAVCVWSLLKVSSKAWCPAVYVYAVAPEVFNSRPSRIA